MIMIENQERTAIYDIAGKNIVVGGPKKNTIYISNNVSIVEGVPAVLGIYNDEKEAKSILESLINTICSKMITNSSNYIIKMVEKEEREQENEQKEEGLKEDKV